MDIKEDSRFRGQLQAQRLIVNEPFLLDAGVAAGAAVDASKLDHEFRPVFSDEATAAAAAVINDFYIAREAGTIEEFSAWLVTPPDTASGGGGRTAIVDLLVNGASVLSAALILDHSSVSRVGALATITTPAYAAGAVISRKITLGVGSTGSHPLGVAGAVTVREVTPEGA